MGFLTEALLTGLRTIEKSCDNSNWGVSMLDQSLLFGLGMLG